MYSSVRGKLPLPATAHHQHGSASSSFGPGASVIANRPDGMLRRRVVFIVAALSLCLLLYIRSSSSQSSSVRYSSTSSSSTLPSHYQVASSRGKNDRPSSSSASSSAAGSSSPRAVLGRDGTSFHDYLETHFPLKRPQPYLWLTLADEYWSETGASALNEFVRRLNAERSSSSDSHKRPTEVITLCLDEQCIQNCEERGTYAYGGFMFNRPEQILPATWPKLASLIEVLKNRDVFFVDSDVSFKLDPYPYMEPYMNDYDLIAQENDAFDHFNTGWFWMRKGQVSSDAWNEVLERDLVELSRDQNNLNEILGTAEGRACDPTQGHCDGTRPLKSTFVATNGLRVKVLDSGLFRSHHFENDVPTATRHSSVSLHLTCGDDGPTKIYAQKLQGFWTDVPQGYYTEPPRLITIDHFAGSTSDLTQLIKIVLMVSKYTQRAFQPPSHATFTDLKGRKDSEGTEVVPTKRINSAFPIPHLELALGVKIVEPAYATHAARFLIGGASTVQRDGMRLKDQDWIERERIELALGLIDKVELDMRHVRSVTDLLKTLFSPPFRQARVVRLMNHDWPGWTNWREWSLSRSVKDVRPCEQLEERPSCDHICRFVNDYRFVRVDEGWEERDEWVPSEMFETLLREGEVEP